MKRRITAIMLGLILLAPIPLTAQYQLERAFPALRFNRPVDLQAAPGDARRLFVVEQAGVIRVFENTSSVTSSRIFLDIRDRVDDSSTEMGLLGLAFHPDFRQNGYFYVNYTAGGPRRTVIARFQVSPTDSNQADPDSEFILLSFNQPYGNHNGGQLVFGPDGYLYIATGDGGSGGDPQGNAQNRKNLLGNILRIDVNQTSGNLNYAIPADNPFVGNNQGYREEIYAYGLRNPWRFSFDPETGWLWCADVGQNRLEEINLIKKGGNYGWNIMEGSECFNSTDCDRTGLELPIWEYDHSRGDRSITGGFVYRGSRVPELVGAYIYGDFVSGRIWALRYDGQNEPQNELLLDTNLYISSFGIDARQELYICAFDGYIYRFKATVTGVQNGTSNLPREHRLIGNFPNPFNPETEIVFQLAQDAEARIEIWNLMGQRLATLVEGFMSAGTHRVRWHGQDARNHPLPSGIYLYRLVVNGKPVAMKRMVLLQ